MVLCEQPNSGDSMLNPTAALYLSCGLFFGCLSKLLFADIKNFRSLRQKKSRASLGRCCCSPTRSPREAIVSPCSKKRRKKSSSCSVDMVSPGLGRGRERCPNGLHRSARTKRSTSLTRLNFLLGGNFPLVVAQGIPNAFA